MATCNGCGAAIDFVLMDTGKKMPVSAKRESIVLDTRGPRKFVTNDRQLVSGRVATSEDLVAGSKVYDGREPHWAVCPAAERFRAKGRVAP